MIPNAVEKERGDKLINSKTPFEFVTKLVEAKKEERDFFSHTGSSCILLENPEWDYDEIKLLLTIRDQKNRSLIKLATLNFNENKPKITIQQNVLEHGELGMFDENGVSYPCAVTNDDQIFLYFTGWMPTVLTPFQTQLGLASANIKDVETDSFKFSRVSLAPILERTDSEPYCVGAAHIIKKDHWKMWYTGILSWGKKDDDFKHKYTIKFAESEDGIYWKRDNIICIDSHYGWDHSIGTPTIYQDEDYYHMWFCYRGENYKIGYAYSKDGIHWIRDDQLAYLQSSEQDWDRLDQCYPCVFRRNNYLWMIYAGNNYGDGGLGIAKKQLFK